MKICDLDKRNERGFILVTSIILLAILMGLGAAAMFKTQIEMKVSASAMESAKAFAAAQAGLDKTYAYWSGTGSAEFASIAAAATATINTGANIMNDLAPAKITDLGVTPTLVDGAITGSNARVYNLTSAGISAPLPSTDWNANGFDKYAQVAVWTTRFKPSTTGYPYADPYTTPGVAGTACSDCTAVTYVLGRSGNAYKLLREYAFISTSTIQAFGAMMNAPGFSNDVYCDAASDPQPVSTTTPVDPTVLPSGTSWWTTSHMIDATQAPGGVAMASNNGIEPGNSSKAWGSAHGTGTTLTTGNPDGGDDRAIDMYVIYDPGKVAVGDYPKVAGNNMSAIWATVVRDSLFETTPMDYFTAGSQLFPMNAYREAANRISGFRTETINGYAVDTGGTGGGMGTPLTAEVATLRTNNSGMGRAGTLDWNELTYNIQRSIPMYGLLRFMIPMQLKNAGGDTVCGRTTDVYEPHTSLGVDPLSSVESPGGKLIVYGGALFDFYIDDGDGIYEPASESLLTRDEAQASSKVNVNNPLMFNPVMDAMTPRTGQAASCDILNINCYPNGSPSWDLLTDAFNFTGSVNVTAGGAVISDADGIMDLIYDVDFVGRDWSGQVYSGGSFPVFGGNFKNWMTEESQAVIISTATSGSHLWSPADKTRMRTLLDYYIRTTSAGSRNEWYNSAGNKEVSVDDIERDYLSFYIDTGNDLSRPHASAADLYHSFLPSGYIHGWKRALAVTGLAAESGGTGQPIWNVDLINNSPTNPNAAIEGDTFYVSGVGATVKIDETFKDIPSEMYAGGLVDMHHAVNTSGVIYTPDMLELEQKDKGSQVSGNGNSGSGSAQAALQYMNGIIISGGGVYMKDETSGNNARTVISYDDTSIDNLPTTSATPALGRKYWQELK